MRTILQMAVVCLLFGGGGSMKNQGQTSGTSADHSDSSRTVAVAFTDIKFDDKVGIFVLLTLKNDQNPNGNGYMYDHVVAVINDITNVDLAGGDLLDFLVEMKCDLERLTIVRGSSAIRPEQALHEVNFIRNPEPITAEFQDPISKISKRYPEDIHHLLNPTDTLHVYQIAPTPRTHIEMLPKVAMYHLVHGHNSQQEDDTKTLAWLQSIQGQLGSKCTVWVTSSRFSFSPAESGNSQLYTSLVGRFPQEHLERALKDPFHAKKLRDVRKFLKANNIELKERLIPAGHKEEDLEELVLLARWNKEDANKKNWRPHFAGYLRAALTSLEKEPVRDPYLLARVKNVVLPSFEGPLQVLMCDANHIIEALTADQSQFKKMRFGWEEGKGIIFENVPEGDPAHGLTLYGLSAKDAMTKLGAILPTFSRN